MVVYNNQFCIHTITTYKDQCHLHCLVCLQHQLFKSKQKTADITAQWSAVDKPSRNQTQLHLKVYISRL
jgi:hypothetical protein